MLRPCFGMLNRNFSAERFVMFGYIMLVTVGSQISKPYDRRGIIIMR